MHTRAAKRRRLVADDVVVPEVSLCLLPLLQPVRLCLHAFLSDRDATRLMQTSHSIAASLLADHAFVDHVFTHHSLTKARQSFAFYARYHMRILRLCLPKTWNAPLVDRKSGRSLLPASLLSLTLGSDPLRQSIAYCPLDRDELQGEKLCDEEGRVVYGEREVNDLIRRWEEAGTCDTWDLRPYGGRAGIFNLPIPPGALPHSLRFLQLGRRFDQPLQVGSIPDSVEVLQLGAEFNQRLEAGHLPVSLTQLMCDGCYNQTLRPGVLPAGLRRLRLGHSYDQRLTPGALPSQLQQLSLGLRFNQPLSPGAIPPLVTHLRLSYMFDQPLLLGSISQGVVRLHLGDQYNQPLLSSVLPTSLRELVISRCYTHALLPGSLPDGLQVLAFSRGAKFQHTLQPGVLPASVVAVSMSQLYEQRLVAGGIPSTVRWLRLPGEYAEEDLSGVLSPGTRVVWWAATR